MTIVLETFKEYLWVYLLASTRIVTMFSVLPFMSDQVITGLIRNSIAFAFMLIALPPIVASFPADGITVELFTVLAVKEALLGFLIGFIASIPFWIASGLGFIVDNQRGSAMAANFDPLLGDQTSVFGILLLQVTIVLFFASGAFKFFLYSFYTTYQLWPVFDPFPEITLLLPTYYLKLLDYLVSTIVLLGSPILICLFLTDFGLGMINRYVPQLNVFFLAMPIKSLIAVFLFIIYLGVLLGLFKEEFLKSDQAIKFLKEILK